MLTSFYRKEQLPSFFIIGGQKCGTTFLDSLLKKSLFLHAPPEKETDFFTSNELYEKGLAFYKKKFNCHFFIKQTFEACPNYLYYPHVAKRIHQYNPNVRLIILVRNPIERAYSAWNMYKLFFETTDNAKWYWKENVINSYFKKLNVPHNSNGINFLNLPQFPTFREVVEKELELFSSEKKAIYTEPGFLGRGIYGTQLSNILEFFDKKQILIIETDELKNETSAYLKKIKNFLGLKRFAMVRNRNVNNFKGVYTQGIDPETRSILSDFFDKKNEAFFEIIGKSYKWK